MMRRFALLALTLLALLPHAVAQTDSIDLSNPPEGFVDVSLLVAGPGTELHSALGHACLRMRCAYYGIDCVYSFEAESADDYTLPFLMGRLKMGMRAVPTARYVETYAQEHRSLWEYDIVLPMRVKQRLWQQLDGRLLAADIPYDFLHHGCAQSCLRMLRQAWADTTCRVSPSYTWPEPSRKHAAVGAMRRLWPRYVYSTLVGGAAYDQAVPREARIVLPSQLVELLSHTEAYGHTVIADAPRVWLEEGAQAPEPWLTPLRLALMLLALSCAAVALSLGRGAVVAQWMAGVFLALQTVAGGFFVWLVLCSSLPCTEWNWLLVPFNPLPLVLLPWRRWAWPCYGVCVVVWASAMLCWPTTAVGEANVVMAVAVALGMMPLARLRREQSPRREAAHDKSHKRNIRDI